MSDKPTRWDYVTTAIIAVLCGCWTVCEHKADPAKFHFEPFIAFITAFFAIVGYSRWKGNSEDATATMTQNAEKIYNIENIENATFKVLVSGGGYVAIVALLVIGIWQKNEVKELLGFNRFFEANDSDFKILVLPFKQMCTQDGKSYDAGFVVSERLNSIIHKEKLQIKTHYWANYDFKDFDDETAKSLRAYHHADMILFGAYQTDACSGDGNQVCINYITDEKWKMGETGINLNRDYQKGGMDELKTGKLQEKIESLATLISLIAQVKSLDHEAYVEQLKDALNDDNLGKSAQASIYVEIADKLRQEGKLQELITHYEKALKICEANNDKSNVAMCYERLGDTHSELGNFKKALNFFEKVNELSKELCGAYSTNINFKNGLAISYQKLGKAHSNLGDFEKALFFHEKCNLLSEELYDAYPMSVSLKNGLAISNGKLGEAYSRLGNMKEALFFYEKCNLLKKELYSAYPMNVSLKNGLAISNGKLGEAYSTLGDMEKAIGYLEEYNRLENELYTAYPTIVAFKDGLAISSQYLGYIHSSMGDVEKAVGFLEKNLELSEELYADYPTNVRFKNGLADSYYHLGKISIIKKDNQKAKAYFEESKKLLVELVRYSTGYEQYQQFLEQVQRELAKLKEE